MANPIAMECLWSSHSFSLDESFLGLLPEATRRDLLRGSNTQFLDSLADLALDPSFTDLIYATFEPLFTEICSRWMARLDSARALPTVAALARLLHVAPHYGIYAEEVACRQRTGPYAELFASDATSLIRTLPELARVALLVTVLRLVDHDASTFECLVPLPKMQVLLSQGSACVKYLAAKLICYRIGVSEASFNTIVDATVGDQVPLGPLDHRTVDFRFWSLWEVKRCEDLVVLLKSQQANIAQVSDSLNSQCKLQRHLNETDLLSRTACFAGHLFPRVDSIEVAESSMIPTKITEQNIHDVASALSGPQAVLITGLSGTGKTAIVTDIARRLGKLSDMLVLHLNDQTDAKLLVGVYTSGATPGSFDWQPGVLTTAVREGRWVFIEDIDRAPPEITSLLLPLLERNEVLVPNLGGWIQAARSFKVIASARSNLNSRKEEINTSDRILGYRHWRNVHLRNYKNEDISQILAAKYPSLQRFGNDIMAMYWAILDISPKGGISSSVSQRALGIGELLRFCARTSMRISHSASGNGEDSVPEAVYDHLFLDGIDCFAGSCDSVESRDQIASTIARKLHISPEKMRFCLSTRIPKLLVDSESNTVSFGRIALSRKHENRVGRRKPRSRFAETPLVLRHLESLAMAVRMNEPCLLVGETGVGKTAIIQEMANSLGMPLAVVNLSQQSEVNDLLGGFKPLNCRALAVPLKEMFDDLFNQTFSSAKNITFVKSLDSAFHTENWSKVLAHFKEARKLVELYFKQNNRKSLPGGPKRRRIEPATPNYLELSWQDFLSKLSIFERHITSADGGIVFSFVEGNLVKAVRSGGWVLLDEINLASPDTLECLADLLSHGRDEAPFLLLSETGNIQKIVAHPEFRLFGAMNPATDIGKRDLPPSIRSRFAEFFIHSPEQDISSLVNIVLAYLHEYIGSEKTLAEATSTAYTRIRSLERENRLVDGSGQKPNLTLRTLTRCLTFASDLSPIYGIRRGLLEGFSVCFLTALNTDSKLLVSKIINEHLAAKITDRSKRLPKQPEDGNDYVSFNNQFWLRRGELPLQEPNEYIITAYVDENLTNLVRATLTRRFPVLLQGPTSSGKTSMVEYLAARSGNKFVRINNHEHTDIQEYLGNYVSTSNGLVYQEGVLVQALRKGHWIVLDELNLAPTDVLEALNRLLDDNRELLIPETQEIVRPHKNFMLFATQNPPGLYGGRKVLSRALRNRFVEIHFDDIPENELETILKGRCPQIAPPFCSKIVAVYKRLSILRQSDRLFEQRNSFATLRDLFRWAQRNAGTKKELAIDGFLLLAERVRNNGERTVVKNVLEEVIKEKIDPDTLYQGQEIMDIADRSSKEILWTKGARRLALLVQSALKNNEPVLLVGDTGCGKTSICQALAVAHGTTLNVVNAHQNTETGDLIGSQRPIRNRAALEDRLKTSIEELFDILYIEYEKQNMDLASLLQMYDSIPKEILSKAPQNLQEAIQYSRDLNKVLFEWADGSLIHAMRRGEYYLLDEISLADDSVLERLNSVLEPARSIVLAEKGSKDNYVSAAHGFQFLATMNPGGDYGKKELSPALRNRFTEIWVPPLSVEDDIQPILEVRLLEPYRVFTKPMIEFGVWFTEAFQPPGSLLSIRDMLAWTELINSCSHIEADIAFVHGAAMVYVDRLGATPSSGYLSTQESIAEQRTVCFNKLARLANHHVEQLYQQISVSIDPTRLNIGQFSIPRHPTAVLNPEFSFHANTTRSNAAKVLRALQLSKPILIEGSPGVGKTTLIAALANSIGVNLTRINLSDQTDLIDLFGSDVPLEDGEAGHFGWRDAAFLRTMQEGGWVLLDEMNLASQSILEGLNACLDHRGTVFIPELGRSFHKHPNFTLFAAQNPHHQGGGRKGLPASFVNRFTVVYADALTSEDLNTICFYLFPQVPRDEVEKAVSYVVELQQLANSSKASFEGGPWEFNLRDLLRWLNLNHLHKGFLTNASVSDWNHLLFENRARNEKDRAAIEKLSKSHDLSPSLRHVHYRNYGASWYQCGFGLLERTDKRSNCKHSTVPVPSTFLESLMVCVHQGWPVLLVGPSGSGKSALVSHLASFIGTEVVTLPLSSDTDAFDLIGGYEQLDNQKRIFSFLSRLKRAIRAFAHSMIPQILSKERYRELLTLLELDPGTVDIDLDQLRLSLQGISAQHPKEGFESFELECAMLIRERYRDDRARFEWADGVLVQALEHGLWLILDNANLCSASVLDRLNALLEPNGWLTVHENRRLDGSPRVIRAHPNFRIFLMTDPRLGELSRAMRNRCVEIHLPYLCTPGIVQTSPVPIPDASVFRFGSFLSFDWAKLNHLESQALARVCLENLSFSDYDVFASWLLEQKKGLNTMPLEFEPVCTALFKAFDLFTDSESKVRQNLEYKLRNFANVVGLNDELALQKFIRSQPTNILENAPLLDEQHCPTKTGHHPWWLQAYDIIIDQRITLSVLEALAAEAFDGNHLNKRSMSRLQRSIFSDRDADLAKDSTQPAAYFFTNVTTAVARWVETSLASALTQPEENLVQEISDLLIDFFDFLNSASFDATMLQTYLSKTEDLASLIRQHTPISEIGDIVISNLRVFKANWRLSSGGCIDVLWKLLKPSVSTNSHQLNLLLACEDLAQKFDEVMWVSNTSLEHLINIRGSFAKLFVDYETKMNDSGILDIKNILLQDQNLQHSFAKPHYPYFCNIFEGLRQHVYLRSDLGTKPFSTLDVISARATSENLQLSCTSLAGKVLQSLRACTGIDSKDGKLMAVQQQLSQQALIKLSSISEVPLSSLRMLREEMDLLGPEMTRLAKSSRQNALYWLNRRLLVLHQEIYRAHKSDNRASLDGKYEAALQVAFGPDKELNLAPNDPTSVRHFDHKAFQEARETYLIPSLEYLIKSQSSPDNALEFSSHAWITFFTGMISLYIPDKSYDPSLRERLDHDRWIGKNERLTAKVKALRMYQKYLTGESNSLRLILSETKLHHIGQQPLLTPVVRPPQSRLITLQGEFSNILRSIWQRLSRSNPNALESVPSSQSISLNDVTILRDNIAQAVRRLNGHYRDYDDLVMPVIDLLYGLDVGFELKSLAQGGCPSTSNRKYDDYFSILGLPFSCGQLPQVTASLADHSGASLAAVVLRLKLLNLQRIASGDLSPNQLRSVHECFTAIFNEWHNQLKSAQREYVTKSSFYRYAGVKDGNEEDDEQDLSELFPDSDKYSHRATQLPAQPRIADPKQLAILLAELQGNLLQKHESHFSHMLQVYKEVALDTGVKCSLGKAETLLPALVLEIAYKKQELCNGGSRSSKYNFYKDTNAVEAEQLRSLLWRTWARFGELKAVWPEQSTLDDVLQFVKSIFDIPHSEPVSFFLPKVERLHSFVNEWQSVASRQYSASSIYDDLTSLLVRWRRLELSTWAQLLDFEDDKCLDDSRSWWFIAYELVIHSSICIGDANDTLESHIKNMAMELSNFLSTTACGIFSHRLDLLYNFGQHAALLSTVYPQMSRVSQVVENVANYYSRYRETIHDHLKVGRQSLEKDMREAVLLASWKDTNILALRESAKKSHFKLLKMIRKYRSLLSEDVSSCLSIDPPMRAAKSEEIFNSKLSPEPNVKAWAICQTSLHEWSQLPLRFKDSLASAAKLKRLGDLPPILIEGRRFVDDLSQRVVEIADSLKRETPSILTEENRSLVKHLKTRKKRAFADVLKEIRALGFQANPGTESLDQQVDLSTILAGCSNDTRCVSADPSFFGIVDNILAIRQSAKRHSEDITNAEVIRSTGYLESMLSTILQQRKVFVRTSNSQKRVERVFLKLEALESLSSEETYNICRGEMFEHSKYRSKLVWLKSMMEATKTVLQTHADLAGMDSKFITQDLESQKDAITHLESRLEALPILPVGLFSDSHKRFQHDVSRAHTDLRKRLAELKEDQPDFGHYISTLLPWTTYDSSYWGFQEQKPAQASFSEYDEAKDTEVLSKLTCVLDSIFLQVQNMHKIQSHLCLSVDEPAWLYRNEKIYLQSFDALRIEEVVSGLEKVNETLQSCGDLGLPTILAFCSLQQPVFAEYRKLLKNILEHGFEHHLSFCKTTQILSSLLKQVVEKGFCSPGEPADAKGDSEKLEDGTGLGEGEGEEDISRDIQDDEDLSELAQEKNQDDGKDEVENEKDAVDMADEDLAAEIAEESGESDENAENKSDTDAAEDDMEDEIGSVSVEEDDVVDEKLWDGKNDEEQDTKGGNDAKGQEMEDMTNKNDENAKDENNEGSEPDLEAVEENELVGSEPQENVDPRAEDEEHLDIPEDMNLDHDNEHDEDTDHDGISDDELLSEASEDKDLANSEIEDGGSMAEEIDEVHDGASQVEDDEESKAVKDRASSPADTEIENNTEDQNSAPLPEQDNQQDGSQSNIEEAANEGSGLFQPKDSLENSARIMDDDLSQNFGTEKSEALAEAGSGKAQDGDETMEQDSKSVIDEERASTSLEDSQPFKKLGDALERWHRMKEQIAPSSGQSNEELPKDNNEDASNRNFEHLFNEEASADTQALAAATEEQTHGFEKNTPNAEEEDLLPLPDFLEPKGEDHEMEDILQSTTEPEDTQGENENLLPLSNQEDSRRDPSRGAEKLTDDELEDIDTELSVVQLSSSSEAPLRALEDARRLWGHCEAVTRDLALILTEQLRLILAPTQASKMRGDFRTGKRLNIKRIIPYIASQYKRDKIWMRRTVPSKRTYQVLLAVDDSKSMSQGGAGRLALESLALLCSSLAFLEVGQVSVVSFGADVSIAHNFDQPFSAADAGPRAFQHFGFQQTRTDVRRLVACSLDLFRRARATQSMSSGSIFGASELWQLQLVISDGLCDDHEEVRRLIRQAQSERIMIVFVIVDAVRGSNSSIVQMQEASFELDAQGEIRPRMSRYLDRAPFAYYLIVSDVRDLPQVLSTALRQWFAEVAGAE